MILKTPVGELHAAFDEEGRLTELRFGASPGRDFLRRRTLVPEPADSNTSDGAAAAALVAQLDEYFSGARKSFDLPLAPRGTPFQLAVWNELLNVPYGHTITYAELARRIAKPSAVRAVGAANGANPIPVIVPCHRVIGSNGTLTGYGGGIERKQWLLALEGRRLF